MTKLANTAFLGAVLTLTLPFSLAFGQTKEEKIRELRGKVTPALVVVNYTGEISLTTSGAEIPTRPVNGRSMGVVIGENGLVIVSNSTLDRSFGLAGVETEIDGKQISIQSAKCVFSEITLSYGDTTVLKGKLVSQQAEADVAFILPDQEEAKTKGKKFDWIDLSNYAAEAESPDEVVSFSRLSASHGFMVGTDLGHIRGVFKGNRTHYLTSVTLGEGMPVFTPEGKILGISLLRIVDGNPVGSLTTLSAASIEVMANLAQEAAKK